MGKNKLARFAENEIFPNVFQPSFYEIQEKGFALKGNWRSFFKNDNPITLELGCGKGEYTIKLAKMFPDRNFIGVDIKGARFWRGAKTAIQENLSNVAFVRTRIDQIPNYFTKEDNVEEIWITFPDPQPRDSKEKKRLTSAPFLERYRQFAQEKTTVNLKTDSEFLFNFTHDEVVVPQNLTIETISRDIYKEMSDNELLMTQTFYEQMWLKEGLKIHYIKFHLFG